MFSLLPQVSVGAMTISMHEFKNLCIILMYLHLKNEWFIEVTNMGGFLVMHLIHNQTSLWWPCFDINFDIRPYMTRKIWLCILYLWNICEYGNIIAKSYIMFRYINSIFFSRVSLSVCFINFPHSEHGGG